MSLITFLKNSILGNQYGHPTGVVGRWLGAKMVREHAPETAWTISLLDLKPEDNVLELGFGAGKAVELVADKTIKGYVAGVDISQTMVRSASRRNARGIRAGRVSLLEGDLTNLPFEDSKFDKVFTIQTIYFWPDLPGALAEICRVLKPGGTLVITLSTGTTGAEASGLTHYQTLLEEKVLPEMQKLGFSKMELRRGPVSRQFITTAVFGIK